MPILKNVRHEAFAQAYVTCGCATEAYRRAGYKADNADVSGPRLLGNDGIAARIHELRTLAAEGFVMDRSRWLRKLQQLAEKAEAEGKFQAACACLRQIGLAMPGFYAPEAHEVKVSGAVAQLFERLRS